MATWHIHANVWKIRCLVLGFVWAPKPPQKLTGSHSLSIHFGGQKKRDKEDISGRQFFAVISCHLHLAISPVAASMSSWNLFFSFPLSGQIIYIYFLKVI